MKINKELRLLSPLELMLRWNRYCDASGREGDCILLNEDRTYNEAFDGERQAMTEIINSHELKRNEGFLVPVWGDDGKYRGMRWVSETDIGGYIDLAVIKG